MTHVKVWDPKGQMFEVTPLNARDLVNHAGWSFSAPSPAEPEMVIETKKVDENGNTTFDYTNKDGTPFNPPTKPTGSEDEGEETSDGETTVDPFEGLEMTLEGMTRKELQAYALETFNVKLDGRSKVEEMIDQILKAAKKT